MSELADSYARDGFAVLRGAVGPARLQTLRDEVLRVGRGDRGAVFGQAIVQGGTDDETLSNILAIHFPHKISDVYRSALSEPAVVDALTRLIGPDVKAVQSMLFVKPPGKPGQPWHQDEHFIPTRDRSLTGVWIALDDADEDNGCLWAIPGSHQRGVLYPMRPQSEPGWDLSEVLHGFPDDVATAQPIPVKAGDAILFNGYVIHGSFANTSPTRTRRALVNHYMNARSLLPWAMGVPGGGAREDARDIVMVAGEDPYAWKGSEDLWPAFIRPDGAAANAALRAEMSNTHVFGNSA